MKAHECCANTSISRARRGSDALPCMRADRSSYRRSQRSRIRSKQPPLSLPRVLAVAAIQHQQAEQLPSQTESEAEPQQEAPAPALEAVCADGVPDENAATDALATYARAAAASGSGREQAARLQAAFEHSLEDGATADQSQLQALQVQQPRPPLRQRQWRDRQGGAGRHTQQTASRAQVRAEASSAVCTRSCHAACS